MAQGAGAQRCDRHAPRQRWALTQRRAADSERRATAQQAEDEARRRATQLAPTTSNKQGRGAQEVLRAQSNADATKACPLRLLCLTRLLFAHAGAELAAIGELPHPVTACRHGHSHESTLFKDNRK